MVITFYRGPLLIWLYEINYVIICSHSSYKHFLNESTLKVYEMCWSKTLFSLNKMEIEVNVLIKVKIFN